MTELRAPRVRQLFIEIAQRFEEQRALEGVSDTSPEGLGLPSRNLKRCRGDDPLRLLRANLYNAPVVIRDSTSSDRCSSPAARSAQGRDR
jgi:hypothetical protein